MYVPVVLAYTFVCEDDVWVGQRLHTVTPLA